jgi:hypothetical protein
MHLGAAVDSYLSSQEMRAEHPFDPRGPSSVRGCQYV